MVNNVLPEIDKIRLFVADAENRARSDLWFIHSHGEHVYAAPQKLGGQLKLSLHPAGAAGDGCDCQFGHPRTHADLQVSLGFSPMRPLRWNRPATPPTGAVHVVSILFPTDHLGFAPQPPNDGKTKLALPAAPPGQAVEAGLFISRQLPSSLEESFIKAGATPLIYMDLPNGEFVSLVVRHRPFINMRDTFNKLSKLPSTPLSGAPKVGETLDGRLIIVGELPKKGEAFQLIEAGPMKITRTDSGSA